MERKDQLCLLALPGSWSVPWSCVKFCRDLRPSTTNVVIKSPVLLQRAHRRGGLVPIMQVGLDNPAELKAAKLARSVTRGLIDKDLKPNSDERRRINAVLQLPPNKPLSQEAKALLWRFR